MSSTKLAKSWFKYAKPAPIDWMADIRAATKAIETARQASRANKLDILAPVCKSVELPRDKARALRVTVVTKRTK